MPRKGRKTAGRLGSQQAVADKARADKARYERCRRRRWGLVKKAREYSTMFGAEVYLLMKDEYNAQYFTSEDRWSSMPTDLVHYACYGCSRLFTDDIPECCTGIQPRA